MQLVQTKRCNKELGIQLRSWTNRTGNVPECEADMRSCFRLKFGHFRPTFCKQL